MKVQRKEHSEYCLGDLEDGEVFSYCGVLYLKTNARRGNEYDPIDTILCARLESGEGIYYVAEIPVTPVKGKFVEE